MSRPATTITYLEMSAPPNFGKPKLEVLRASPFPSWYFLALYQAVGEAYYWIDMLNLPKAEIEAFCQNENRTLFTHIEEGRPVGFYVLEDFEKKFSLDYFGMTPEATGLGLGGKLLEHAIATAWEMGAQKLSVNTCTLDHPHALPLYQSRGFMVTSEEHRDAIP